MLAQVLKQQIKPTEKVSRKPYSSRVLSRYIVIDGQSIRAHAATDEEFYYYVYGLLGQFYAEEMREDAEVVELWYRGAFDLDWSSDENRVTALNQLNAMNRARRACGLPLIALFAEGLTLPRSKDGGFFLR
jgi:hypothetical protein